MTSRHEVKARKPLRDAKIEVVEVPGKPGAYRAVAFLKPHFQLDELTVSLAAGGGTAARARSKLLNRGRLLATGAGHSTDNRSN